MDKLLVALQAAYRVKLLLDIILNRLDIVVGDLLYVLNALCAFLVKLEVDVAKTREEVMVERFQLRERKLAKSNEILYLHTDAITNERVL